MHRTFLPILVATLLAVGAATDSCAKNVDLSTVPDRDTVQLTIYNSEDLTLVRETRKVSFKPGANSLQFSWSNTLIDPTSVELRFQTDADKLVMLDTTFPHDKRQMLYWNVQSDMDGEATIEITYFTSGITWSADYVCVADQDESEMSLEGFVRVTNNSGEQYENAQVRLVVGKINLVEKIAQLARISIDAVDDMEHEERGRAKRDVAKMAMARASLSAVMADAAGESAPHPKQIIKEGLSEYFIYSIEGTETVPHGWSKRMRSFHGKTIAFDIQYRYRPPQYGDQLVRLYLLTNDEKSKLGTTPLPDGMVRVFRDNGRDGLSFLVAQPIKYVPVGDKIELNLGADPDVRFELIKLRVWRDAVWMQVHGTTLFRRVDEPGLRIDVRSSVAGWDDHAVFAQRVRNYTAKPVQVQVRRSFDGHTLFRSELAAKNHDYRTVQYTQTIEPGQQRNLRYEVLVHQGHNRKQNNVTIEQATVAP